MLRKSADELSVAKHVLFFEATIPATLGIAAYLLYSVLPTSTPADRTAATILAVVFGIFTGWIGGIIFYFLNKGIHGWSEVIASHRTPTHYIQDAPPMTTTQAADITDESARKASLAPKQDTPEQQAEDPWHGKNPYGCCRYHTDADGYPSHGGPGCRHPQAQQG